MTINKKMKEVTVLKNNCFKFVIDAEYQLQIGHRPAKACVP